MWKFLIIASLAYASGVPLQNGVPTANWFEPFQTAVGMCRCPSSSMATDQTGSSIGTNQPVPLGVSNAGTNFYQNFVINGAMPSGLRSTPSKAPVRDDYTYTPGVGAHKLHMHLLTWNEARKSCNEEGGHLAIINSVAEAQVLTKMLNNSVSVPGATYNRMIYLGIHDLYQEGEWVTIFGDPVAHAGYEEWSGVNGKQPNNLRNVQHCGVLQEDGGFGDVGCTDLEPYFCEIPTA